MLLAAARALRVMARKMDTGEAPRPAGGTAKGGDAGPYITVSSAPGGAPTCPHNQCFV